MVILLISVTTCTNHNTIINKKQLVIPGLSLVKRTLDRAVQTHCTKKRCRIPIEPILYTTKSKKRKPFPNRCGVGDKNGVLAQGAIGRKKLAVMV